MNERRLTLSAGGTSLLEFSRPIQNIKVMLTDSSTSGNTIYFQEGITAVDTASSSFLTAIPGIVLEVNLQNAFSEMAFSTTSGATVQIF